MIAVRALYRHRSGLTLLCGAIVLVAAFEWLGAADSLRYERSAIAAGELWRLLTAHLVHFGPTHTAMNALALVAVMAVLGSQLRLAEWCGVAVLCGIGVTGGLWLGMPGVAYYVGLSGILHGLVAAGAIAALPKERGFAALVLALLGVKLLWEASHGPTPGTADAAGGPVLIESHRYGALPGVLYGIVRVAITVRGQD